jgi:hypothetical protein
MEVFQIIVNETIEQVTIQVQEQVEEVKVVVSEAIAGASAYHIWLQQPGNGGKTVQEFLASLKGANMTWDDLTPEQKEGLRLTYDMLTEEQKLELKGEALHWQDLTEEQKEEIRGESGYTPEFGVDYFNGLSAFEIWQQIPGNEDKTEEEYFADIRGDEGKTAYEVAVENGFVGTEAEWLATLVANAGDYEIGNQVLIFENQLI